MLLMRRESRELLFDADSVFSGALSLRRRIEWTLLRGLCGQELREGR